MKKGLLIGAGVAVAGVAAGAVISHLITKNLVKFAIGRDLPKSLEKQRPKITQGDRVRKFQERIGSQSPTLHAGRPMGRLACWVGFLRCMPARGTAHTPFTDSKRPLWQAPSSVGRCVENFIHILCIINKKQGIALYRRAKSKQTQK